MPGCGYLCQPLLEWQVSRANRRVYTLTHSLYESIIFKLLMFFFRKLRKNGEEMRDEKRTLECLKKAARIASQCMDTGVQVQICVELLNHYLFYFERGNSLITVDLLNQVCPQNIFDK